MRDNYSVCVARSWLPATLNIVTNITRQFSPNIFTHLHTLKTYGQKQAINCWIDLYEKYSLTTESET